MVCTIWCCILLHKKKLKFFDFQFQTTKVLMYLNDDKKWCLKKNCSLISLFHSGSKSWKMSHFNFLLAWIRKWDFLGWFSNTVNFCWYFWLPRICFEPKTSQPKRHVYTVPYKTVVIPLCITTEKLRQLVNKLFFKFWHWWPFL